MRTLLALFSCLLAAAPLAAQVAAEDAFPGVTFRSPVEAVAAPGQPGRVYVVEQGIGGRARIQTLADGDAEATTFLDIDSRVLQSGEQGLLGLAFHPDYEANGRFFVHYSASGPRRGVVAEYARREGSPLEADPSSERVVLEVPQPFSNHNGGKIAFGPDGYLYVSLGDGGSGNDPQNNAQNLGNLLGTILRLDIDDAPAGAAYGVPADNPFVGVAGARDEIYAYGLRNVWKFSFDAETGALWAGDVGQNRWEEIDLVEAGANYGWRPVEGPDCTGLQPGCDPADYAAPVFFYPHNASGGFSITGGFVYRGSRLPTLAGRYLYGDFVSDRLWELDIESTTASASLITSSVPSIASINPDWDGEPLVVSYQGSIFRLVDPSVASEAAPDGGLALRLAGPNPSAAPRLRLSGPAGVAVRLTVHDVRGREVARVLDGPLSGGATVVTLGGLAPGVYLARAESALGRAVLRVAVAR